ncbi:hypothetical protein [Sphingobacterium faecale]|uniref:Uncharacterized protein n=1 Tax=Sphingobacterium faecale TaxID=2803775 RepID=A0ABS1R292_9SPHI|nr:hypothetical protein [Sphingobacterium faecale]MBL1408815.1 hypothetical protein [Sphingobacterium faecale]
MSFIQSKRLKQRNEGLKDLEKSLENKAKTLIIHYSCESFVNLHGRSPRITSISIRNLQTGQTISFSIHIQAQINTLDFNNLSDEDYDKLEFDMLDEFYKFARERLKFKWIHWNMHDTNFGFEAISNRFRILGGEPLEIDIENRFDLPRILSKLYTYDYEDHGDNGKLLSLCARNGISCRDALSGKKEAEAFENKNYLALHKSTLNKISIIESILEKTDSNCLKVKVSYRIIYGLSISGIKEIIANNWILNLVRGIIIFLLGVFVEKYIF